MTYSPYVVLRVGQRFNISTTDLVNEWVSFSTNSGGDCPLEDCSIERFGSQVKYVLGLSVRSLMSLIKMIESL